MHGWLHNAITGLWGAGALWALARTLIDIGVVAYLIYHVMMLARGTRAKQIIIGLIVFALLLFLSDRAHLTALNWILKQLFVLGPVAIVILFFPELRHALEEVGRLGFWGRGFMTLDKEDLSSMIGELVQAAEMLSEKKIGALMVLERETGLTDIVETGTLLNAVVSAELLGTIFYPGNPLHDGAAIIRRDRIVAAGCTLPLSDSRAIGTNIHTRHKAALGISEQSDALAVVVSEETGIISLAFEGKMVRHLRDGALRDRLLEAFTGRERALPRRHRRGLSRRASSSDSLPPAPKATPTAAAATKPAPSETPDPLDAPVKAGTTV